MKSYKCLYLLPLTEHMGDFSLWVTCFLLGHSTSAETGNFYVLGNDGIYVIDPVAKSLVAKLTKTEGLCTKDKHSSDDCWYTRACVVNDTVFVGDINTLFEDAVHVIDIRTRMKIKTIETGGSQFSLRCLQWRKEVWVQFLYNRNAFDVIETECRTKTGSVVRAKSQIGSSLDTLLADEDMLGGKTAFVTGYYVPGIHELNLDTKNYTNFRNLSKYNCTGTLGIAYNSYNKHLYVGCDKNDTFSPTVIVLELDTVSDTIKNWGFPGFPFVSPDGRHAVFLYRTRKTSRMNILAVNGTGFNATTHYPELLIPGGVSHAVFYPKDNTSKSFYVFLTLDYTNKMAVVDLDLAKNGKISDVKYIENVDVQSMPYWWVRRGLFIGDKWIITPANQDKTVVIINAETQKVHGKISGVNGGHFAVWVPAPTTSGTSVPTSCETPSPPTTTTKTSQKTTSGSIGIGRPSCLIFLIVLYVFM